MNATVVGTPMIRRLGPGDAALTDAWRAMFGKAFGEEQVYSGQPPSPGYVEQLLADPTFIAIAATIGDRVIGGAAAYELRKFEQERSEIYLYDLAVDERYRRRGVARAMIARLREIANGCGAWMMFVQADQGDAPAIALYEIYGPREEVLHFDIPPVRAMSASPAVDQPNRDGQGDSGGKTDDAADQELTGRDPPRETGEDRED